MHRRELFLLLIKVELFIVVLDKDVCAVEYIVNAIELTLQKCEVKLCVLLDEILFPDCVYQRGTCHVEMNI